MVGFLWSSLLPLSCQWLTCLIVVVIKLIRCRSKTGTARYQVEPTDDISVLLAKVSLNGQLAESSGAPLTLRNRSTRMPLMQTHQR